MVKIEILDLAEQDLLDGYRFYEKQAAGLGRYFLEHIYLDIESLKAYAGIHLKPHKNYYRLLSKKFPFPFITPLRMTRHLFKQSWTAVVIPNGSSAT